MANKRGKEKHKAMLIDNVHGLDKCKLKWYRMS